MIAIIIFLLTSFSSSLYQNGVSPEIIHQHYHDEIKKITQLFKKKYRFKKKQTIKIIINNISSHTLPTTEASNIPPTLTFNVTAPFSSHPLPLHPHQIKP